MYLFLPQSFSEDKAEQVHVGESQYWTDRTLLLINLFELLIQIFYIYISHLGENFMRLNYLIRDWKVTNAPKWCSLDLFSESGELTYKIVQFTYITSYSYTLPSFNEEI